MDLNNYSFEFNPTETSAGSTLFHIANHLPYKCRNDLIYTKKWTNLNLLSLKLSIQKNQILLQKSIVNLLNYNEHNKTNKFLDSLASNSFIPLILQPIRITSHSNTHIDHIFSNVIDANIVIWLSPFLIICFNFQ